MSVNKTSLNMLLGTELLCKYTPRVIFINKDLNQHVDKKTAHLCDYLHINRVRGG